jgi:hypothetical protein
MFQPMVGWIIDEWMDLNNRHTHNGIKRLTCQYQHYNTSQILVLGGYVNVKDFCTLKLLVELVPF